VKSPEDISETFVKKLKFENFTKSQLKMLSLGLI